MNICAENLAQFESGAWRLCDVITGNETWVYHRKIESKQRSTAWVAHGESRPTVVRRQMKEKKTMFVVFFTTTGPLLVHEVPVGLWINGIYYRDECLKPLFRKLVKEKTVIWHERCQAVSRQCEATREEYRV